jgi:23S rRNA pseudouridine2605 synthase
LNRALSKLGILSRSQAIEAIREGRVRVDGRTISTPATLVVPERVRITVDGMRRTRALSRTILLNKPRGVVTTRRDPEGRRTVYDVVAPAERLVPVGRLDLATSGLLLLTNDTKLADWLTDPSNAIPRVYVVTVRGRVTEEMAGRLENPVEGLELRILKASNRESHLIVQLCEGKNRQVRRMFESIDREVTRLKRVRFGGLELGSLEPGEFRDVSLDELRQAFPGASFSRGATS